MTKRDIIIIDEAKCNGCGQCVTACAEGALEIIDGKAKLVSETYCDGLGACLGSCPQDAITIEKREAEEFDEEKVEERLKEMNKKEDIKKASSGFTCPGMMMKEMNTKPAGKAQNGDVSSQLTQWPVQLKLLSANAPYLKNCDLLLTADCVPFAMGDFHEKILKNKKIAVGCPKLDNRDYYVDKLADIIETNDLNSLTVVHMQVPCCSAMTVIAEKAIEKAQADLEIKDITIGLDGQILR